MLLRTPWSRPRGQLRIPRKPLTRAEILARREAARARTTPKVHADGSHCHHCPEDP